MMTKTKWFCIAMLLTMVTTMTAQDKKLFTLEDLNYGGNNFYNLQPKNRYYAWWGDQLIRTDVEECYTVDKKTGKETLLFTLDQVNEWAKSNDEYRVRHLMNATFPYAGQSIVALGNRKSYILLDFKTHEIVWQDSLSGQDANDWTSTSKACAYVKDWQLYVQDAEGKTYQLSTDGSREMVYGKSVHRDEFGIEKGTFWSPDGNSLAFYRMDQSMVADYPQVDVFNRMASYEPDKYPMTGEVSHKVTVGVFNVKTGKTVYLQTPKGGFTDKLPADGKMSEEACYFTNVAWSPDSKTIYLFELNRDQNDCRLVSYDAGTGMRLKELYREQHPKYVEPLHPIVFLPWDATKYIMQSQCDGYNHLYLCNAEDGSIVKQLTSGSWVVLDLLGFNEKAKSVIIASNEVNPIQRNTWAVDVKTGKRTLLDNGRGYHYAELSKSGQWLCDRYSEPDVPRVITVAPTHVANKSVNLLVAEDPWKDYQVPEYTSGSIKAADGVTDLYYRMVKPADFDSAKKYPTVIYVYGGPHAHNVDARWHYCSRSWETYMAQKGYIVFILDNRGSENRGREFEQATFRQLGQEETADQMQGVAFLKSLPYVDQERMGVHGWSFGGYMTITMMTHHPEVFKVGVAGGPVIDWKWYEVMYGERYMDTPQQNPEGYEKCSLLNQAKNLKGKLQIITGYNDATVVPQHCLAFIAKCIEEGTQPDFFVYPGEPHNMRGHQSVHLHERITQYFEDYLK